MSLLRGDNSSIRNSGKHLRVSLYRLDDRRADEDGVVILLRVRCLFQLWNIQVRFEGIHLASERVSLDFYIHESQQRLIAADIFGKEDRARARPPDRVALSEVP